MDQLAWSLTDEVAPYFESNFIKGLCTLIDEKANSGLKYNDLKQQLLDCLAPYTEENTFHPEIMIYNRAYEFARYY